jgi:hypothetical protein
MEEVCWDNIRGKKKTLPSEKEMRGCKRALTLSGLPK